MGTPDYATTIFKKLIESKYEVVALFTQADKKVGRKQVLTLPHIKQFCIDENIDIPIFQPQRLRNNTEAKEEIEKLNPDFIIVAAYGQILPKEILDIAPCINLHASILPKYRGASPIQEALLNDDEYTGVTSMLMEEGLDSGDILEIQKIKITPTMEVLELFNELSQIAAHLTISTLDNFEKIKPLKQKEEEVSFCSKIKKENGLVSLENAKQVYLKYKAYSFWPGIFLESGLKLKKIELFEEDSSNQIGEILQIAKDYVILGCKKGSLKLITVQAPSKKAVNVVDFIRGQRLKEKDILK
nr:MAG: methionyl-tRNA formyltransferase [Arcobacter sp.]